MNFPPDTKTYFDMVWTIVRQIPSGIVSTYGQIASMIPAPTGVDEIDYERLGAVWVGKAMNAVSSSDDTDIPWQRVINSQGGISLPEGSRAAIEQRRRLENEGLKFNSAGKVSINAYGWDGPDADWLRENRLHTPKALKKPDDDKPGQMRLF
jgi:methylated-DNA-protein-cysteine methyltransferase-like protein